MQAIETDRSPGLPSLMVTTRLRLMPQGTSCSFLQAVAHALHSMQRSPSQRNFIRATVEPPLRGADLAQGDFRLVHSGDRIEAVGRHRVHALAEHDGVRALGVAVAHVLPLIEPGEVEGHPGDALTYAIRDECLHLCFGRVLGPEHPNPLPVLYTPGSGVAGVYLDEHVLLQLGEPAVRACLLPAALVLHEAPRGEDDREVTRNASIDRALLDREPNVRQTELTLVGPCRILRHELRPGRVDRLAVHRNGIGQVPGERPRLAVAVVHDAMLEADALDSAREVDRPGNAVHVVAADLVDDGPLLGAEVLVPT